MRITCPACGLQADVIASMGPRGERWSISTRSSFPTGCKLDALINNPPTDEFDCDHFRKEVERVASQ